MKLIREGLHRTRTMALLMAALAWAAAFLRLFSVYANKEVISRSTYSVIQANPLLLLSFMIFAPFLTLQIFSYLNSRAGSDLYHASPLRRKDMALSFFAAVMLWIVLIIVGSILISGVCGAAFKEKLELDMSHALIWALQLIAASFLVAAATFLAMTVTGTLLTNIAVALLIIFLPRLIMFEGITNIGTAVPLLDTSALPDIVTGKLNTAFSVVVYALVNDREISKVVYQMTSCIYTFLLGTVYLLIGLRLYEKRPSEAAGQPALSGRMQGFVRCAIGFIFTFPAVSMVVLKILGSDNMLATPVDILIWYLLSLGAMIVYEFVTVRRLPKLKTLLRGFAIILILHLLWCSAVLLIEKHYESERVDAEQIESVSFTGPYYNLPDSYLTWVAEDTQSWFGTVIRDVELQDDQLAEIVSQTHEKTAKTMHVQEQEQVISAPEDQTLWLYVSIRLKGGKTLKRHLEFAGGDLKTVWEVFARSEEGKTLTALPALSELQDVYSANREDRSALKKAYEMYREEVRNLTPEEFMEILLNGESFDGDRIGFACYFDEMTMLYGSLPVTEKFPKTQALLDKIPVVNSETGETEYLTDLG